MLTAIVDLIDTFDITPGSILIVAPRLVATHTWPAEVKTWAHLRGLDVHYCGGTEAQRHAAVAARPHVMTIGTHNLKWLVDNYYDALEETFPFDFICVDESSKLKGPTSGVTKAARKVSRTATRFYEMTATPAPNSIADLWSQITLIDKGARLGRTITEFRDNYFHRDFNGFGYTPRKGAIESILHAIDDMCFRLSADEHLPRDKPTIIDRVITLPNRAEYDELESEWYLEIQDVEIEALEEGPLLNKLRQYANGSVYYEDREWVATHHEKLDVLETIIDSALGEPVLIAYEFIPDRERIRQRTGAEIITEHNIDAWNRKEIPVGILHPASAGHGLNLQRGGNILVFYTVPWSLDLYEQTIGRLDRQGQEHVVRVFRLLAQATIETDMVVPRINSKRSLQDRVKLAMSN